MKNHIVFVFVGMRGLWMGRHAVLKMQCKWACRLSDHSEISSWDLDWLLPSSRSSWIQFSLILKSFIVPTKVTVTSELPHHILRCKGHNGPDSLLMPHSSPLSLFLYCQSGFTCHWPFFSFLSFFFQSVHQHAPVNHVILKLTFAFRCELTWGQASLNKHINSRMRANSSCCCLSLSSNPRLINLCFYYGSHGGKRVKEQKIHGWQIMYFWYANVCTSGLQNYVNYVSFQSVASAVVCLLLLWHWMSGDLISLISTDVFIVTSLSIWSMPPFFVFSLSLTQDKVKWLS